MVSHILIMFNRMYENMSCNILQIEFHRLQEHTYHLVLEDSFSKDSFRLVCSRSYFNVFNQPKSFSDLIQGKIYGKPFVFLAPGLQGVPLGPIFLDVWDDESDPQ